MKRIFSVASLLMLTIGLMAQNQAQSKPGSAYIVKDVKPAILSIVPNSVQFLDATGNKAIDASETCKVVFQVTNSGLSDGYGCTAKITGVGSTNGISYSSTQYLDVIPVNGTQTIEFPITTNMNTTDGRVKFTIQVEEPNGFGTDPMSLDVATYAFIAPHLQVTDYTITGTESKVLKKKEMFNLQVVVQNTQRGTADDVNITIDIPQNVYLASANEHTNISQMKAGQHQALEYSLLANNNYEDSILPITIHIQEKYGRYAEDRTIALAFAQKFNITPIVIENLTGDNDEPIVPFVIGSDVDKNIPQNPTTNQNTYAYIIANEEYQNQSFAQVPFAKNDGTSFRNYCEYTLGLPKGNIHFFTNVTSGLLTEIIDDLKTTAEVNSGSNIIFYYAGHGAPNEATKEAFLLPVDAYSVNAKSCLSLQYLYSELKALENNKITVFLDACFSGANRDNKMLASGGRLVTIKPKANTVEGNLVVFSASSGDETAWPYKTEYHGLFTYCLLKKLKETNGNATYAELKQYLHENVRKISHNVNGKLQTPTVESSATLGDSWLEWRLK